MGMDINIIPDWYDWHCCYTIYLNQHCLTSLMLDSLKNQLAHNYSSLAHPSFLHTLTPVHLQELTQLVEGKAGHSQLHPKVSTALYSIIIMKGHTQYNTKTAIECLTKYYRQLQPSTIPSPHPPLVATDSAKSRQVLANLLIRIPTFSNYKLIIKDITPQLLPLSIVLRHRPLIFKQCPNLYKDYLINQHKYVWHRLLEGDQGNYPLSQDMCAVKFGLYKLAQNTNPREVYSQFAQMEKLMKFIGDRIADTQKQEINIDQLCQEIQSVITFVGPTSSQQKLLPLQVLSDRNKYIRLIKSSCIQILRRLILRFQYAMWRKFSWLVNLLHNLFKRGSDDQSVLPSYLISLSSTVLEVFGLGFYDFDKLVKDQETSCLAVLISALCYNDYTSNNKQQAALLNFQQGKNRKKNDIHLNIFNTTVVDSAYEHYLKTSTEYDRQLLLSKILTFLSLFYGRKGNAAMSFYHSAQLLSTLATSKNSISAKNTNMISNIRQKILFRGYENVGDHFEQFCQDTFRNYIKRRKQNKLQVHRCLQVLILPNDRKPQPQICDSNKLQKQHKESQFRRTNSFDLQFEGWAPQRNSKKSEQRAEKSEMFYSIKQCSVLDENEGNKKQKPQEQDEFILTPQF